MSLTRRAVVVVVVYSYVFFQDLAIPAVNFVTVFQAAQQRAFFSHLLNEAYKFAICQTSKHLFPFPLAKGHVGRQWCEMTHTGEKVVLLSIPLKAVGGGRGIQAKNVGFIVHC